MYIVTAIIIFLIICLLLNFVSIIKKCLASIEKDQLNINMHSDQYNFYKDYMDRYKIYYDMMNKWIRNKSFNKSITTYFHENNIKSIAIYGIGEIAMRLLEEINDKDINVKYFIEKMPKEINYNMHIPIIHGTSNFSKVNDVDAIIITPVYDVKNIIKDLKNNGINTDIILLKDIIDRI